MKSEMSNRIKDQVEFLKGLIENGDDDFEFLSSLNDKELVQFAIESKDLEEEMSANEGFPEMAVKDTIDTWEKYNIKKEANINELDTKSMYASEMEDIENQFTTYFGDLETGDITKIVIMLLDNFARYCFENKYKNELNFKENEINEALVDKSYGLYCSYGNCLSKDEILNNIKNEIKFNKNVESSYNYNWNDILNEDVNTMAVSDIKNGLKNSNKLIDTSKKTIKEKLGGKEND